ncbi:MAG: acetyltransferase, partial [Solirubrobacterales bacterium]
MPKPVQRSARYMPALDGVRALAVCAVVAYHLGLGWAPGGLLGVGMFFTLSGYLITDLLLGQWDGGRRGLAEFWGRRARRLLPALYLMLVVVSVWVAVGFHSRLADVRGQVISALLYVNNWWQISQHVSYFAQFGPPSPLNHLWSLAVEEQFYVVWPWLLLIGVWTVRERRRSVRARPRLAGATLALAAASAIEMALLYRPSLDPSRVYDGSDTRAFGLLVGAALAMVWPSRALTGPVTAGARRIIDGLGSVGLGAIVVLVWRTNQYSPFLYHGGLVALSLATVLVVAAGAHPASRLARVLGWAPLRWVGVRSYGIYLWHWP